MQSLGIPFFHTLVIMMMLPHFPFHENDQTSTVVELGKWCIILLNSAQPQRIDGKIADGQLEQLSKLLEQLKTAMWSLPRHHHPFAIRSAWIDQHKLKNSSDLLDTIQPFQCVKRLSAVMCIKIPFIAGRVSTFYRLPPPVFNSSRKVKIRPR